MQDVSNASLEVDDVNLLLTSFCLNHEEKHGVSKSRHKILWRHVRGDLNVGKDSIHMYAMTRILALIGYDSECKS